MKLRPCLTQVRANMCALPKGLLLVTMRDARSYLLETRWKNRMAASASKGI